jgi:hypothetical protein
MKTHTIIYHTAVLIGFAAMSAVSAPPKDTSYSETRVVQKSTESTNHERGAARHESHYDDDDECCQSFGEAVSHALANLCGQIIWEGVKTSFAYPCAHLFAGPPQMSTWRRERVLHEFGIGIGTSYMHKLSVGMPIKVFYSPLVLVGDHLGIREHIGLCAVPSIINRDFERDLYTDGVYVGTQRDITHAYTAGEVPILTELLFFPSGKSGSFYWTIGAGPQYRYERVKATRILNGQRASIHIVDEGWMPKVSIGIGRYGAFSRSFGDFSMRYEAAINPNQQRISTPGDNSRIEHCFSVNWSIAFW